MAIAAAAVGSNRLEVRQNCKVIYGSSILKQMLICRVIVYQLWSGLPVANANSNVENEEDEKKVETQGVLEDVGQGEVGHGGGGRRQSGEGGRNL